MSEEREYQRGAPEREIEEVEKEEERQRHADEEEIEQVERETPGRLVEGEGSDERQEKRPTR